MPNTTDANLITQKRVFQTFFWIAHAICLYLFLKPSIDSGISFEHFDKIAHFVVFVGLAFLIDYSYKLKLDIKISVLVIYGLAIELLQSHFGREASVADALADVFGLLVYFYLLKPIVDPWFEKLTHKLFAASTVTSDDNLPDQ